MYVTFFRKMEVQENLRLVRGRSTWQLAMHIFIALAKEVKIQDNELLTNEANIRIILSIPPPPPKNEYRDTDFWDILYFFCRIVVQSGELEL